jgi:hypothetical protein
MKQRKTKKRMKGRPEAKRRKHSGNQPVEASAQHLSSHDALLACCSPWRSFIQAEA